MSAKEPQQELIQLIYGHLKEQGFHSAAEELHRHSPQGGTNASVSLFDIYQSWLTNSKKRRRPESAKHPKTPAKVSGTKQKMKKEKPAGKTKAVKKSAATKRKKGKEKSAGDATKAKKSKSQTDSVVSAGADDSDSDSSLDVEKWKKLALHMTEADFINMEAMNSLSSSALPPKKTRVRKPRAKPPAKTATQIQQKGGSIEKNTKKPATQTPARKSTPKKSRSKDTAAVTPSGPSKLEQNLTTIEDTAPTLVVSLLQKSPGREKRNNATPSKEMNDKKEKEGRAKETSKDEKHKEKKKKSQIEISGQQFVEKPREEKKKATETKADSKRTEKDISESSSGNVSGEINLESIVQGKKHKKKKEKAKENSARITELKIQENTDLEPLTEEKVKEKENSELIGERKIKKKKKKEKADKENSAQITEENNLQENTDLERLTEEKVKENSELIGERKRKKKEKSDFEENPAPSAKENKLKEKMADSEVNLQQTADKVKDSTEQTCENSEQIVKIKKAKKRNREQTDDGEDDPEHLLVKEKKSKKNRESPGENLKSTSEENQSTETLDGGKKKEEELTSEVRKKNNPEPESRPLFNLETSPPTEKKKKKKKKKSSELPESPAVTFPETQMDSTDSHKKVLKYLQSSQYTEKKKSLKSSLT
ncbi:uncharacterized protein KZ484_009271 isoform 1-T1 [Pholidichthys leucotaenia]